MAKFIIRFSGFAYVEADDAEAAKDAYDAEEAVYEEKTFEDPEEADAFSISL